MSSVIAKHYMGTNIKQGQLVSTRLTPYTCTASLCTVSLCTYILPHVCITASKYKGIELKRRIFPFQNSNTVTHICKPEGKKLALMPNHCVIKGTASLNYHVSLPSVYIMKGQKATPQACFGLFHIILPF